jgi:uncharacterized membrane protein YhhN
VPRPADPRDAARSPAAVLEYVTKPFAMVLLFAAMLTITPIDSAVRVWFIVALIASILGDVLLMLAVDVFVFGLGAFFVAHIAYIGGLAARGGLSVGRAAIGVVVIGAVAVTAGRVLVGALRRDPDHRPLVVPVIAYTIVISTMATTAIASGNAWAIAGALLFMFSDLTIGITRFVQDRAHSHLVIMVTYHLGQAGLVLSLLH